jgi:hypothetical protein
LLLLCQDKSKEELDFIVRSKAKASGLFGTEAKASGLFGGCFF